ncbi:MAG: pyruvate carboxylase subunit B [Chloroflexi bacterium]|nr:pyruvate carboxylase subunit B [Chloroflexota bacterium]
MSIPAPDGAAGAPPSPKRRKHIGIIDTTVRDGHQSLWATRMRNWAILGYVEQMDRMGFKRIELVGGAVFDVAVRYLKEDPWERIRLVRQKVRRTPLQLVERGQSLFTFQVFPDDVVALTIRRAQANGIGQLFTYDSLNDVQNLTTVVETARAIGLPVSGMFVFSISPVHTDDYYVEVSKQLVALGVDAVGLKDPSGLLTPERTRTLVPALRQAIGDVPLEVHSHALSGLAPQCLLEAADLGADDLYTCISPLAHGYSHPPTEWVVHHLERRGFETGVDRAMLPDMAAYFTRVAEIERRPLGKPAEYDPALFEHQIPGGMITNLINQLRELGIAERLDDVLAEISRVRVDLGYPPMVSPVSQYVGTLAVLHVLQGERYKTIPLEVTSYALGLYGRPPGRIEPNLLDRLTRGKEPYGGRIGARVPPLLDKVRAERGPFASDDDLLIACYYAPEVYNPLFEARAQAGGRYEPPQPPLVSHLLRELAKRPDLRHVQVQLGKLKVTASR